MLTVGRSAADLGWSVAACLTHDQESSGLTSDLRAAGVGIEGRIPSEEEGRGYTRFACLLVRTYWKTRGVLRRFQPDVTLFSIQAAGAATGALAAAASAAVPSLLVFQLFPRELSGNERRSAIWKRVVRWGMHRGQRWVAVSEQNRSCIARTFGTRLENVALIRNGGKRQSPSADPRETRRLLGIPAGARVITTVGRLESSKGYLDLLRAIPSVRRRFANAHFLWVGEGTLRRILEARLREAGLTKSVTLAGFRRDVPDILAISDLFVLPSHVEGLPFALVEAALAGLPLVATRVPGAAELVDHESTGLVVDPENPDELANAINRILESDELRDRLASQARSSFSHLTEERMLVETLAALGSMITAGSQRNLAGGSEPAR